jgi:pimeloyl-ACP methyl ester carboxylesterase
VFALQREMHDAFKRAAPYAIDRRAATRFTTVNYEHIPAELLTHQTLGAAACDAPPMLDYAEHARWEIDAASIACPVRIVWGTEDRLLPWPEAAARYRRLLPHADWIELDGVGHCPQLDVPRETAELILGHV